ncbi:uncharacterized protein LOC133309152 [Gastrolobium bilobum]|uniref:uncharacterized protein LOC133309152 n=1 Tax=Gastrolobium bilobum TaxID=150636 RepID=UPI002AB07BB5|nr:uncharacterized protein LOC133309152 [Gastrolobium bilobum]
MALPFFKLLRKEVQYGWNSECEAAFQEIKRQLASSPVLTKAREEEALIMYLSVGDVAVSSVLVLENEERQQSIYFILHKPDLAGRMMTWVVELSEFDIVFESRKAIKSQALADFVRELTSLQSENSHNPDTWKLYVDGSSNSKGSGAGDIIENPESVAVEYSMQMGFPTSNNQAEFEAFIVGLQQTKELGARKLQVFSDSQLVTSQILEVNHIPRNENSKADILSKLASTKGRGNHRIVVEQSILKPTCVMQITYVNDWRFDIVEYLEKGTLPPAKEGARKLVREAAMYTMLEDQFYRKGVSAPLLKCLNSDRAQYVLAEIHEGINGQHVGGKALARKAVRAGYFWPSMNNDAKEHVQKCDQCQRHGKNLLAPQKN